MRVPTYLFHTNLCAMQQTCIILYSQKFRKLQLKLSVHYYMKKDKRKIKRNQSKAIQNLFFFSLYLLYFTAKLMLVHNVQPIPYGNKYFLHCDKSSPDQQKFFCISQGTASYSILPNTYVVCTCCLFATSRIDFHLIIFKKVLPVCNLT